MPYILAILSGLCVAISTDYDHSLWGAATVFGLAAIIMAIEDSRKL